MLNVHARCEFSGLFSLEDTCKFVVTCKSFLSIVDACRKLSSKACHQRHVQVHVLYAVSCRSFCKMYTLAANFRIVFSYMPSQLADTGKSFHTSQLDGQRAEELYLCVKCKKHLKVYYIHSFHSVIAKLFKVHKNSLKW